eukprot:10114295-Lingulodinium_polyedra.AAC.1
MDSCSCSIHGVGQVCASVQSNIHHPSTGATQTQQCKRITDCVVFALIIYFASGCTIQLVRSLPRL